MNNVLSNTGILLIQAVQNEINELKQNQAFGVEAEDLKQKDGQVTWRPEKASENLPETQVASLLFSKPRPLLYFHPISL